jgi:hypothetical protein
MATAAPSLNYNTVLDIIYPFCSVMQTCAMMPGYHFFATSCGGDSSCDATVKVCIWPDCYATSHNIDWIVIQHALVTGLSLRMVKPLSRLDASRPKGSSKMQLKSLKLLPVSGASKVSLTRSNQQPGDYKTIISTVKLTGTDQTITSKKGELFTKGVAAVAYRWNGALNPNKSVLGLL